MNSIFYCCSVIFAVLTVVLSIPVPEGVPVAAADSVTATSPSPKSPAPAASDIVAAPGSAASKIAAPGSAAADIVAAPGSAASKTAAPVPAAADTVAAPGSAASKTAAPVPAVADTVAAPGSAADKPTDPAIAIVADSAVPNDVPSTKEIVLFNSAEDYTVQGVIEYHLEKGGIRKEDITLRPGQTQTIILKSDVNNITYKVASAPISGPSASISGLSASSSGLPATDLLKGENAEIPKESFKICQTFDGTAVKPTAGLRDCNTLQPGKKD